MKTIFLLIISVFLMSFSSTYSQVTSSSVTFKIKNMGLNVDGSFEGFEAVTIDFDPQSLAQSQLTATIKSKTIDTDNNMRDNHLREEEYFDVANHPTIKMQSVSMEKTGENKFVGLFDLTIKGITKRVKVPFTHSNTSEGYQLKGNFEMNRRDFKVGGSSWVLSDDLKVFISISVKS